ncbi:hypothetical protein THERU_05205 [Thermocrinis ruber]|uniref:Uncharacterized protein n=1 Tax=Thermocrinis ruber TaxID=75906 RepID=W0DJ03_9AQUI|nr:hypothetical protein THERU_05205 [Thermocrinis ruber]
MGELQSRKDKSASCYPTQWAWNEDEEMRPQNAFIKPSPSHPVGLKHLPKSLKVKTFSLSKLKQPTERAH